MSKNFFGRPKTFFGGFFGRPKSFWTSKKVFGRPKKKNGPPKQIFGRFKKFFGCPKLLDVQKKISMDVLKFVGRPKFFLDE